MIHRGDPFLVLDRDVVDFRFISFRFDIPAIYGTEMSICNFSEILTKNRKKSESELQFINNVCLEFLSHIYIYFLKKMSFLHFQICFVLI
jgi:hypothetical protein